MNRQMCSMHYIREVMLKQLVLENMRRVFLNVQAFEQDFVKKQLDCYSAEKRRELQSKQRELEKSRNRIAEIDNLIRHLYEDHVSGKLTDDRFNNLSTSYEEEQAALREKLPELERYLSAENDKTDNVLQFVQRVKRITEPLDLTAELVHEFIEKIVVYEAVELEGNRYQMVDIHYNGIGIIHTLTLDEYEASFQLSRKEQLERQAKLKTLNQAQSKKSKNENDSIAS